MTGGRKAQAKSAVSFVVVPVILIVLAIAFAVYMIGWTRNSGVGGGECGVIEIQGINCSLDTNRNWVVTVVLRNVDDVGFSLSRVSVNGKELSSYGASAPDSAVRTLTSDIVKGVEIPGGGCCVFNVWIGVKYGFLTSGNVVFIEIGGSDGVEYRANIMLA